MPLTDEQRKEYAFRDDKGYYRLLGLRQRGVASLREDRPDMFFPIYVNPETEEISLSEKNGWDVVIPKKSDGREGRWMWGKQKCKEDAERLVPKMIAKRGEYDIFVKDYLDKGDKERTRKFKSVLDDKSFNNQNGTQEVKALLGGEYMSFPKSMEYIKRICIMGASPDSLILDFFSGSATTAHAVMQLNAEDGGNRKFIMVQLPEATDEKSEAYKAGYKNICEIGKERIRCAGKKIKEESPLTTQDLDIGFRVLKLDTSNMLDVYYTPQEFDENRLFADNIKTDRSEEDLLFQVMIEQGIDLSSKIERMELAGKTVWNVAEGYLLACFDEQVNESTITAIAKQHPVHFVMRDSSLANDQVADNFEQIWEEYSKDTERKII